jgi:2-oxoglutarate/2-oxoacid ferredoxin oxidoreductase subunit alpha
MNPATHARDIAEVRPGGYVLYDSSWPLDERLLRPTSTSWASRFGRCASSTSPGAASGR